MDLTTVKRRTETNTTPSQHSRSTVFATPPSSTFSSPTKIPSPSPSGTSWYRVNSSPISPPPPPARSRAPPNESVIMPSSMTAYTNGFTKNTSPSMSVSNGFPANTTTPSSLQINSPPNTYTLSTTQNGEVELMSNGIYRDMVMQKYLIKQNNELPINGLQRTVNGLEHTVLAYDPQSTDRTNGPQSTERANGPHSSERANGPQSTERGNGPLSTDRANGPQSTERLNGRRSTDRENGLRSTDPAYTCSLSLSELHNAERANELMQPSNGNVSHGSNHYNHVISSPPPLIPIPQEPNTFNDQELNQPSRHHTSPLNRTPTSTLDRKHMSPLDYTHPSPLDRNHPSHLDRNHPHLDRPAYSLSQPSQQSTADWSTHPMSRSSSVDTTRHLQQTPLPSYPPPYSVANHSPQYHHSSRSVETQPLGNPLVPPYQYSSPQTYMINDLPPMNPHNARKLASQRLFDQKTVLHKSKLVDSNQHRPQSTCSSSSPPQPLPQSDSQQQLAQKLPPYLINFFASVAKLSQFYTGFQNNVPMPVAEISIPFGDGIVILITRTELARMEETRKLTSQICHLYTKVYSFLPVFVVSPLFTSLVQNFCEWYVEEAKLLEGRPLIADHKTEEWLRASRLQFMKKVLDKLNSYMENAEQKKLYVPKEQTLVPAYSYKGKFNPDNFDDPKKKMRADEKVGKTGSTNNNELSDYRQKYSVVTYPVVESDQVPIKPLNYKEQLKKGKKSTALQQQNKRIKSTALQQQNKDIKSTPLQRMLSPRSSYSDELMNGVCSPSAQQYLMNPHANGFSSFNYLSPANHYHTNQYTTHALPVQPLRSSEELGTAVYPPHSPDMAMQAMMSAYQQSKAPYTYHPLYDYHQPAPHKAHQHMYQHHKERNPNDQKPWNQKSYEPKPYNRKAKDKKAKDQKAKDQKAKDQKAKDQKAKDPKAKNEKAKNEKAKNEETDDAKIDRIKYLCKLTQQYGNQKPADPAPAPAPVPNDDPAVAAHCASTSPGVTQISGKKRPGLASQPYAPPSKAARENARQKNVQTADTIVSCLEEGNINKEGDKHMEEMKNNLEKMDKRVAEWKESMEDGDKRMEEGDIHKEEEDDKLMEQNGKAESSPSEFYGFSNRDLNKTLQNKVCLSSLIPATLDEAGEREVQELMSSLGLLQETARLMVVKRRINKGMRKLLKKQQEEGKKAA